MNNSLEKYLSISNQTIQEVLAGEAQCGTEYVNKLIETALNEKKKVVFIPELTDGLNLGLGKYELQPL